MNHEQPSLFPELDQPAEPAFDIDAAVEHIGRHASTPEHKASVNRAYNRDADRLGLLDDEAPQDTEKPRRGTHEAPEAWRLTQEEKAAAPAGIAATRAALESREEQP